MTHNSAIHALTKVMKDIKVMIVLTPTERKAIQHAIEQLHRIIDLEH